MVRVGLGQDSHRFLEKGEKKCVIGGIVFDDVPGMDADSDGDVALHAICNAISSLSGVPILGGVAPKLCHEDGITDSRVYLDHALKTLKGTISHVALSIEGKRPRMQKKCDEVRANIAKLLGLQVEQVGFTVTSGDGLTDFGKGIGLQCLCILTLVDI